MPSIERRKDQIVFLRVLAATGAVLSLAAVACRSEAVTTAEVAELSTSSESAPASFAPASSPSALATVVTTTAVPSPADPAAADSLPATTVPSLADPAAADSLPATTAAPTTEAQVVDDGPAIDLMVIGTELEGGARRESIPLGEKVTVRVSGTSTDHVHIHGYDLFIDLADGVGELTFVADIPGVFEIELEGSGTLLVQMEVR